MGIIIKPVITEKMTGQTEEFNRYGFIVDRSANKIEIKKEIEKMYGVTVEDVNTMVIGGKNKTRFTRAGLMKGRAKHLKKAVVTLADGDVIDFYSNI